MNGKRTVGVIGGAGFWGLKYLRAFSGHPDCELVCITDTAVERRELAAERFAIPRRYDSTDAMLAAEDLDIVSVVLPVSASYDAVMACLAAGVPVVTCEKPISESLARADSMVEEARAAGTPLFCGTALWEIPHFVQAIEWVRSEHLGKLVRVSIPSGFNDQVSGNGCVVLAFLRFITGREIEWVEGFTDPPQAAFVDDDCNAYGTLGLAGGLTCTIAERNNSGPTSDCVAAQFESGQLWLMRRGIILIEGTGDHARPVYPAFLEDPVNSHFDRVQSYLDAFTSRGEAPCSAHDLRQSLEIAIALKLSAREEHRRVTLPLKNRNQYLRPHPYRMLGGDVVGWDSLGLRPPLVDP